MAKQKSSGWLDKYTAAVSDATRTKYTKNTGLKKGVDQPVSNMLDITLGAPQRQLVKMVTGKEQSPSEAMGIKNPYGAFATDAILDPTNLIGAGLLGKAAKTSTKTGIFSKAHKLNPWAFKTNKSNWYRQFGDPGFQDAVKTGTIRGVNEDINKTMLDKIDEPYFYKGEPFFSAINIKPTGNQSDKFLLEGKLSPSDFIPAAGDDRWIKHMNDLSEKGLLDNFEYGVLKKDPSLRNLDNFNIYKKHWLQGYKPVEIPKKENGGWLDKYNDGGPIQPNYNDASASFPPNFVGQGYDTTGRNYSPAWGGQFKDGGKVCDSCQKAQDGKKVSGDEKRKKVLAKAEEVFANSANPYTIPESVVKAGGNSNYVCIQGVCGILSDSGIIPQDYYTNTKFAEKAKDLGFGRAMADINLIKPGDVVQHMSDQNNEGTRFPSHAEIFKRINPDTGEYEFYDYFDKYNGLGGIRTYSKDELEERFGRFKNRDNSGIQAQFFSLDPESLPQEAPQPFPYNLPQKEQEQYFNATHVADTKYYPGDAAQGPILDVPSYERSQTKHELTNLFNDKELDEKLRKELKITDQDLQKAKPLIYGIMDQETDFGNPRSPGRNIKYGLKELLGSGQYSMGPSAVRYDEALSNEAKKAFGINSPKDLSKVKNAYIGALDVLSKGARYTDNNISGHPGLEDKDRMERALYWYNNPSNVVNSDAETFQAISRKANNLFPWQDKQEMMSKAYNSPLEMSVGSYPDKVLKQSKGLHQVIDFNDMNVLPEVQVHGKRIYNEEPFAMGGSMPGAVGFTYARTINPAPSNGPYAKKTMASAQDGTEMSYYQNGLDFRPKSISKNGSVIKDDMGQYNHPGEITEIGSNQITMQGVPYKVLGISDTGDTQMMYPNREYQYDGSSVTEYPMAQDGYNVAYADNTRVGNVPQHVRPSSGRGHQPDTTGENILEIIDPYGVSSWDDIYRSAIKTGMSGETAVEVFGAIPMLGKAKKIGQFLDIVSKAVPKTGKQARNVKASVATLKAIGKYGPTAGRATDAYQAYDQYEQGGQLKKLDQLTNFTNYNTKQPGGWLDKYQD